MTLSGVIIGIAMLAFVGALHIVIGFTIIGLFSLIGALYERSTGDQFATAVEWIDPRLFDKLFEWYDNRGDK